MSSLNENTTDDTWIPANRAFGSDVMISGSAISAGAPITLTDNNLVMNTIDNDSMETWSVAATNNIKFDMDYRGWPWICAKCHKIAFSQLSYITNRFCSHIGWMVKLNPGMKI